MKLDRLVSILVILLQRERISAKELAQKFEVSTRTILRDIDAINLAGIPIVTFQGTHGGIAIAEGYKLDRSVLTHDDVAAIIATLKGVARSLPDPKHQILVDKFKNVVPAAQSESFKIKSNRLIIDLAPWGGNKLVEERLSLLRTAIEHEHIIEFEYVSSNGGATQRRVEPYSLVLKGQSWYLYAFCLLRNEPRLFKVSRVKALKECRDTFTCRDLSVDTLPWERVWGPPDRWTTLRLHFDKALIGLAGDFFEKYTVHEDGSFTVQLNLPENQWLYGYILSFGPGVEVLEPLSLRDKIRQYAQEVANKNA